MNYTFNPNEEEKIIYYTTLYSGKGYTKESPEQELCQYMWITEYIVDIETNMITLNLEIYPDYITKKIISINRENLIKSAIVKLFSGYGIDITDNNAHIIIEYLHLVEKTNNFKKTYTHSTLGFDFRIKPIIYKLYQSMNIENINNISIYKGIEDIKPCGSYEGWKDIINSYVIGYTPLEIALSIGFTAPLVTLINRITNVYPVMVVHLANTSSSGKTTALKLMASIWGKPENTNGALINSFDGTSNAMIATLKNKNGFPTIIDESTGAFSPESISRILYQISNGESKKPANESQ